MKVTVFGIGYVGLVHAAVLATAGHQVCCVDTNSEKILRLQQGQVPFYEPGLEPLVRDNLAEGRLIFTTSAAEGVAFSKLQFIAVGTPSCTDGSADLTYVLDVAKTIANLMETDQIVVCRSTVPVGTNEKVAQVFEQTLMERGRRDLGFDVASNPEFLKQGSAVADASKPDRIIVGTHSTHTLEVLRELYAFSNRNHEKMIVMDVRSAELTKYAANSMLATKISFMNEMASLAEKVGADIEAVRKGIGSDQRIGYDFIYPGIGYGGSCFPKDVQALIRIAAENGLDAKVLRAITERNQEQKQFIVEKIKRHFGGQLAGKTFALWGLSFKPNTDDMREAPSRVLMQALWEAGARVQAYDPQAMEEAQRLYGHREDMVLCGTKETALRDADALIICTEWKAFHAPDFGLMASKLKTPVIFDGRNLFEPDKMRREGFVYYSVGRLSSANA